MVFRILIRILSNNEQLVQRLSESYPMRRAAQFVVRTAFKGKDFLQERNLDQKLSPEQFRNLMQLVANQFKKQLKQAQDEIKRRTKN